MRDFMQKDLFELIKYNAALILVWGSQHFPFVSFRLISLNAVLFNVIEILLAYNNSVPFN